MSLKSAVFSGIKWTAAASALTQIQRFVRLAVLARLLTPEDFGLMGTVQIAVFFVGMFNGLGMANAIVQRKDINERQLSSIF